MNQQALVQRQIAAYQPFGEQEEADKITLLSYCERFDDLLLRQNPFAHFCSSALVLNKAGDKTLMAYHNLYRSWSWLGGHADGEADLLAVALREVEEESGLTGAVPLSHEMIAIDILPVWGHWKNGVYLSSHLHLSVCYLLQGDETRPVRPRPSENRAVQWVPTSAMLERCAEENMRPVYQKLLDRAESLGYLSSSSR